MGKLFHRRAVIGVFDYHDDFVAAARELARTSYVVEKIYSPVAAEEVYGILGLRRSPVRFFSLFGAVTGGMMAFGIAYYSASRYGFIIQGKPVLGWLSFSLVAYEYTLIWAAIWTFIGILVLGRMPKIPGRGPHEGRVSGDRFGLQIRSTRADELELADLLRRHGAVDVYEIIQ